MCLVFFSYKFPESIEFFIASNRDEFYKRKTNEAEIWNQEKKIWSGIDLESSGTWLGIQNENKFGVLTNYRNFKLPKIENPKSRGIILKDFLEQEKSPKEFIFKLREEKNLYEGFNVILGDKNECFYFNNKLNILAKLEKGFYALSNGIIDEPWPKTLKLKKEIVDLILEKHLSPEKIFEILKDKEKFAKEFLPDTGIGYEREIGLSSKFIELEGYGTRSSYYVLKEKNKSGIFLEKNWLI